MERGDAEYRLPRAERLARHTCQKVTTGWAQLRRPIYGFCLLDLFLLLVEGCSPHACIVQWASIRSKRAAATALWISGIFARRGDLSRDGRRRSPRLVRLCRSGLGRAIKARGTSSRIREARWANGMTYRAC